MKRIFSKVFPDALPPQELRQEFEKETAYAKFYDECKYKPELSSEWNAHYQVFSLLKEGLTDALLKRVKTIIRGKIRVTSFLMKKYHKDETEWTFENWVAAYRKII
jgi:hypothetical protein